MKRVDLVLGHSSMRLECCGSVRVPSDNKGLRPRQCLALLWRGVTTGLRTSCEVRLNYVHTHTHLH